MSDAVQRNPFDHAPINVTGEFQVWVESNNKEMIMIDKKCENCVFFESQTDECRRHPPTLNAHCTSVFPSVCGATWCGEFEDKNGDQ